MSQGNEWVLREHPELSKEIRDCHPFLSNFMGFLGGSNLDSVEDFLDPGFGEKLEIPNLETALGRLRDAVVLDQKIAIVGDYDADGVTSTAILSTAFEALGIQYVPILPVRKIDGYGFKDRHVDLAAEFGADLIITVDCGTNNAQAIETALAKGIDVIVTDHHLPGVRFPAGAILVNPQTGTDERAKVLCGAGVAFLVAVKLMKSLRVEPDGRRLLGLAAIGTVADMVPLTGWNRALVRRGLSHKTNWSRGMEALLKISRVNKVTSGDIAFGVGPRLNAAGRMGDPRIAYDLLMTEDPFLADQWAKELDDLNQARKTEERRITAEAEAQINPEDPLLIARGENWGGGVLGIAAGKLARKYGRPCVLLNDQDGVICGGSGRSFGEISLHEFLKGWEDSYETFGGHDAACGISFENERYDGLRDEWLDSADWEVGPGKILYDHLLQSTDDLGKIYDAIQLFQPFGQGNPEPTFRINGLHVTSCKEFSPGHLKVKTEEGIELLCFFWADRKHLFKGSIDAVGQLSRSSYNNKIEVRLEDVQHHGQQELLDDQ